MWRVSVNGWVDVEVTGYMTESQAKDEALIQMERPEGFPHCGSAGWRLVDLWREGKYWRTMVALALILFGLHSPAQRTYSPSVWKFHCCCSTSCLGQSAKLHLPLVHTKSNCMYYFKEFSWLKGIPAMIISMLILKVFKKKLSCFENKSW